MFNFLPIFNKSIEIDIMLITKLLIFNIMNKILYMYMARKAFFIHYDCKVGLYAKSLHLLSGAKPKIDRPHLSCVPSFEISEKHCEKQGYKISNWGISI